MMACMRGMAVLSVGVALLLSGCAHEDRLAVRNATPNVITIVAVKASAPGQLLDTIQPGSDSEVPLGEAGCGAGSLEAIDAAMRVVSRVSATECSQGTWTVTDG